MTADRKINQTIASLRGAKADMEAFSMETDNQNEQQMYSNCAQQLEQVVSNLKQRANQQRANQQGNNQQGNNQQGNNQMRQAGYGATNLRNQDRNQQ